MSGNDQIIVFNDEIPDRGDRQIHLQRLPLVAVIEGDVDSVLSASKKQSFPYWIFAHNVDIGALRNAFCDFGPSLSQVVRAINIGLQVVRLMTIDGGVGSFCVKWR